MENLFQLINDDQKWNVAEWQMRLEWLFRLQKHCDRIRNGTATDEDFDIFWIKFWGFVEELAPPFVELKKLFVDLEDIESEYYKRFKNEEMEKVHRSFRSVRPKNLDSIITSLGIVIDKVEEVKKRFTREEMFWAYDYRTHICHPTSTFYRLRMKKTGELLEDCRGMKKSDIQRILSEQLRYFRALGEADKPNENSAKYFVNKISRDDLSTLQREAAFVVLELFPELALLVLSERKS